MGFHNGDERPPALDNALSWTVGCLVAAAAFVGVVTLVLLVALALQPPPWLQVVIGVALVAGGALLAWLVASALSRSRSRRASGPPRRRDPAS